MISSEKRQNTAKVDWCGFRTKALPVTVARSLEKVFAGVGRVSLRPNGKGSMGYETAGAIDVGGMVVGQYGTGGESQRGWSSFAITGQGCEWIHDWDAAVDELEAIDYEMRRCDLAVDTFKREVTHESVLAGYWAGAFTAGGRRPVMDRHEGWPREAGWTVNVGKRDQAKFFRGYEKGFQLAKRFAASGMVVQAIDGHAVADQYRCEVELKAKDRPLPVDLIQRRDEYFAGAYPFCRQLIEVEPFQLTMSREKRPQLALDHVLGLIQRQWGRSLFTGLVAYQGDISAVWDRIVGMEHSQSLIDAGVLLVDHDTRQKAERH